MDFFDAADELLRHGAMRIDRPAGTAHPRYCDVVYPVDYGFVDGTTAADGGGIDVFRGSLAGAGCVAVATTIDTGKCDAELKLLVDCSDAEVGTVLDFLRDALGLGVEVLHRSR